MTFGAGRPRSYVLGTRDAWERGEDDIPKPEDVRIFTLDRTKIHALFTPLRTEIGDFQAAYGNVKLQMLQEDADDVYGVLDLDIRVKALQDKIGKLEACLEEQLLSILKQTVSQT